MTTLETTDMIRGTTGDDTLEGTTSDDVIFALAGNDYIVAYNGNDYVRAGKGNDEVWGQFGNDRLYGDEGNDLLFGNEENDFINGNEGYDHVRGGQGDDQLYGGKENDVVAAGSGADKANGNKGTDIVHGSNVMNDTDEVLVQEFTSQHDMDGDDDTFSVGSFLADFGSDEAGFQALTPDSGDTLNGGQDEDLLMGGNGDDILAGDKGSDTIYGGVGNDSLLGGNGVTDESAVADVFVFDNADGAQITSMETDVVYDFAHGVDTLRIYGATNEEISWEVVDGDTIVHGLENQEIQLLHVTDLDINDFEFLN